jgi:hypothetical protein
MVAPKSASTPCCGGREAGNADNGHDECDGKEFDHEIPSSICLMV